MKILFYSLYANFLPPFGTQLELMQLEKDKGNELFVVRCHGAFQSCHANLNHHPVKCARCVERSDYFFEQLGIPHKNILNIKQHKEADAFVVPYFKSTDELLDYQYKGFQIGRGVASTLISRSRDLEITTEKYGELISLYMKMAINALLSLQEVISLINPDCCYIYNGRQPEDRPLILICEKEKINFKSYVSGSTIKKYRLFENGVVHYLKSFHEHIVKTLEQARLNQDNIEKTGSQWFESIAGNTNNNLPDFTKHQIKDLLPDDFDKAKINVAIFNSSEDEMKTFQDWQNPIYKNQNEALHAICREMIDHPQVHFYLRIHPNLAKVNNHQIKEINEMNYPNLTVIRGDSKISTYALMQACEKTITFGSSTGPEATYFGKPSILIGKSFYDQLDCVYNARSYQDLKELLLDRNLPAKPAINALKYGFYLATHGVFHNHLKFNSDGTHEFNKKKLEALRPGLVTYMVRYFINHWSTWQKTKRTLSKYGF